MEAKSSLHLGVALFRQYFSASACECGVCGVHEDQQKVGAYEMLNNVLHIQGQPSALYGVVVLF